MQIDRETLLKAAEAGLAAYGECAGPYCDESRVDERSLAAFIARELHQFGFFAVPELLYSDFCRHLGISITEEQANSLRLQRADIAVCDDHHPIAAVEVKIFSERGHAPTNVASDLARCGPARVGERIPVYALV